MNPIAFAIGFIFGFVVIYGLIYFFNYVLLRHCRLQYQKERHKEEINQIKKEIGT